MSFDPSRIGEPFGPTSFSYDADRSILYALACGATTEELDLLLESRGPRVLPSFAVVPAFAAVVEAASALGGDLMTVLHGAQRIELNRPLPEAAELKTTAVPRALFDKGKGALLIVSTESVDESGPVCSTEWQLFFRGMGGFGGERGPPAPALDPPPALPDAEVSQSTLETQALLYRLASGDKNPLHAEPAVADALGFERPILHGLCTLGFATRALLRHLNGGHLASLEARFAQPVFPGEVLSTRLWSTGPTEGAFDSHVGERAVLTRGRWTARG